ncbi:MAG: ASKHA domain-containing protein [Clostridia bacterium]|nr:ASKHA domain-containing protein [Clostridia bacterium]
MTRAVTVFGTGRVSLVPEGTPISEALSLAGANLSMPCGGRGRCGKCICWVSGAVSAVSAEEGALLSAVPREEPPEPRFTRRLACYCRVSGDCTVALPVEGRASVLFDADGELPRYDGEGTDTLGIAADIGTTTVALRLYSLRDGALLASLGEINRQCAFGADVLSRIDFGNGNGTERLCRAISEQLTEMVLAALDGAKVSVDRVERAVVLGNTTMLHFAAGLDPRGIGVSPFIPESLFGDIRPAGGLIACLPDAAELYVPRCISAYLGADITAGIHAGGLARRAGRTLLIDVGTNGEMALSSDGKLLGCATAAGPAFEGAQIEMGMAALPGAICGARVTDGGIVCDTIGGAPARGLCGTGLISAVHAMRKIGAIDESGALAEDRDAYPLGETGVYLTARDIRQVQLAKAAIAAGVETLMREAGVGDVDEVLLAGGFGSMIDPADAAGIGLIPRRFVPKTRAVGNIALHGASQMLFSLRARREAEREAAAVTEVPLATNATFMDRYIEQMMFPEV